MRLWIPDAGHCSSEYLHITQLLVATRDRCKVGEPYEWILDGKRSLHQWRAIQLLPGEILIIFLTVVFRL